MWLCTWHVVICAINKCNTSSHLRCGGIFSDQFVTQSLSGLLGFENRLCRSYRKRVECLVFFDSRGRRCVHSLDMQIDANSVTLIVTLTLDFLNSNQKAATGCRGLLLWCLWWLSRHSDQVFLFYRARLIHPPTYIHTYVMTNLSQYQHGRNGDDWYLLLIEVDYVVRRKSAIFPTSVYFAPSLKGYPWNWVSVQGSEKTRMMALPDGQISFKIGLVV